MSGYASDFSRSNNAVAAEGAGLFPASVLAKRLGVKTGAIIALVPDREWHHTSKFYNATHYYSHEEAVEVLAELKAWQPDAKAQSEIVGATGEYLVWSGTRNHPKAKVVKFGPITATIKGDWFTIGAVRKKKDTRGFVIRDQAGRRVN